MITRSPGFVVFASLLTMVSCLASPVNYWRFEGKAGDMTGGENDSVSAGPALGQEAGDRHPQLTADAPKLPGGASNQSSMEFRQNNRTALAATDAKTGDFGQGQAFTVECWIKAQGYPTLKDVPLTILHKRGGDTTDLRAIKPGYQLLLGDDHRILFNATAVDGTAKSLASKSEIPLDVWTHLAVSRDASGKLVLYVNGTKEAESRGPLPASLDNDGLLNVGANRFMMAKPPFWQGLIDELRISDTALAPEELLYAPQ